MSENLSEVFTSTWWITVFLATLVFTVLGNFLTEVIKTILSKYSASLRSKKSQRFEEQKKLATELLANLTHLFFYISTLIVQLILTLFIFVLSLCSGAAGYFLRVDYTVFALPFFVFALLLAAVALQSLKSIIFDKIPFLALLKDLLQAIKTYENE